MTQKKPGQASAPDPDTDLEATAASPQTAASQPTVAPLQTADSAPDPIRDRERRERLRQLLQRKYH